jgi:type I restriction enzyme R subunit
VKVGPQNVLEQAKRYAIGAFAGPGNWNGYRVPFLYASNGEVIWFLDVRDGKNISRQISKFHTSDALEEMFKNNATTGYEQLKAAGETLGIKVLDHIIFTHKGKQRSVDLMNC